MLKGLQPKEQSSKNTRKNRKELIDIKIIEPFNPPEVIHFDSIDEFKEYLTDNKDEMELMTTQKLNKTYKIDGYTITKLKDVGISLKRKREEVVIETSDQDSKEMIQRCINAVNQCIEQLDVIKNVLHAQGMI